METNAKLAIKNLQSANWNPTSPNAADDLRWAIIGILQQQYELQQKLDGMARNTNSLMTGPESGMTVGPE